MATNDLLTRTKGTFIPKIGTQAYYVNIANVRTLCRVKDILNPTTCKIEIKGRMFEAPNFLLENV